MIFKDDKLWNVLRINTLLSDVSIILKSLLHIDIHELRNSCWLERIDPLDSIISDLYLTCA